MPEKHAILSASSAHRWLHCPPSARIATKRPNESSPAAEEGTTAHALAEYKLLRALGRAQLPEPPSPDLVDTAMDEHTDDYVSFVLERLAQAKRVCADPFLWTEHQVRYNHVAPEGFGTIDCLIVAEPKIIIIDFKYGKGIQVSAVDNPQLWLYAAGALHEYAPLYDLSEVETTIYQPRLGHVETQEFTVKALTDWAENLVKPVALKAWKGVGEHTPGQWCRFCPIKNTCRARANWHTEKANAEFKPLPELTDSEMARLLPQARQYVDWANGLEKHMLDQAVKGAKYEGLKLVEGRSIRKWVDETQALQALEDAGVEGVLQTKLASPATVEKLVKNKMPAKDFAKLVIKPRGKPALAGLDDKRKLYAPEAENDFQPIK